ncbi:hypothetical protein [Clostridium sp. C2-6-12]|uniref:hypothetical protein n=1 Tax=Clostridium sp. C2-6-12 TaxID=2698832 RepID=UPI0013679DD6|nr:hypothetical protein [Clostridium sp. C2-6-12]
MKKNVVFSLCLCIILIFAGCSNVKKADDSYQTQAINEQNSMDEKQETDSNNKNAAQLSETIQKEEAVNDKNINGQKVSKVYSKIKLYEGTYFDDRRFGEEGLKNYCEVEISNVTNTSFDFTIYEVNESERGKENKKVIFLKNTAVFIGDGTKAAFYGKEYTLNFEFPNKHNAYIVATDVEISGFKPLEGKTYVNNKIPGHEFG